MKLNKYIFWILSLTISLLSCWLFQKSSTELHSDFDYMQSLNLTPHADTPMIPIAGGFIVAVFTAIIHGFVHMIFLFSITRKKDLKIKLTFWFGKQLSKLQNIILAICYVICILWIYDYLTVLKIKFYPISTAFLFIAILTTLIYTIWIINLLNKSQIEKKVDYIQEIKNARPQHGIANNSGVRCRFQGLCPALGLSRRKATKPANPLLWLYQDRYAQA